MTPDDFDEYTDREIIITVNSLLQANRLFTERKHNDTHPYCTYAIAMCSDAKLDQTQTNG